MKSEGKWKNRLSRRLLCAIAGVCLGFLILVGLLFAGITWRLWASEDLEKIKERSAPEFVEGLTCWDISRNIDEYWSCMVRGDDMVLEGKMRNPLPPAEFLNGSRGGVEYLTRKRRKMTEKERSRRSRKRRSTGEGFHRNSSYEPYDANFTVTFIPLRLKDYMKEFEGRLTHDYYRLNQTSEELYQRDVNSKEHQSEPPWSYEGFFPPKEWHLLELERFYQPIKQQFDLRMASFRDFGTEALFLHPEAFLLQGQDGHVHSNTFSKLYFWDPEMVKVAYPFNPKTSKVVQIRDSWPPQYVLRKLKRTHWQDKEFMKTLNERYLNNLTDLPKEVEELMDGDGSEETLARHNPKAGYYSEMRFLIPPGVDDKTTQDYLERGLLPYQFNRPNQNYIDFGAMKKYATNLIKMAEDAKENGGLQGEELRQFLRLGQVTDWFLSRAKNASYSGALYYREDFQFRGVRPPKKGVNFTKLYSDYINYTKIFLQEFLDHRVEEQREGPRHREYYSLPLLPHPFRMCRHREPSPINIKDSNAQTSSLSAYKFPHNHCKRYPVSFRFRDDGTHVLIARFQGRGLYANDGQSIRGGIIKGQDLWLDEIHIHIGKTDTTGSEHRLEGKGYAMELQFIFTITGSDPSQPFHYVLARQAGDLFQYREKLVLIIALLVEVVDKPDDPYLFEPLAQAASRFRMQQLEKNATKFRGYTTKEPVWALSDFTPRSTETYYTYRGSLTTPPCFSYIFWSVYNKTLQISRKQFEEVQMWPMPGTDDTGMLAGNVRSMDDFFVEEEEEPRLTEARKAELRAKREGRTLLRSDPNKTFDEEDYVFDYYARSAKSLPSSFLIILVPSIIASYLTLSI